MQDPLAKPSSLDRSSPGRSPEPRREPATSPTSPSGRPQVYDRRRTDRRRRPTPMLSRYTLFGGRRKGDRRRPESLNQYVDLYEPGLAAILVAVALLCALDAVFTLLYIQKGGSEANPIMDWLIRQGATQFVVVKCAVTSLGLVVLCLHKNFRYVRGVIWGVLVLYGLLFLYHLYLATIVT